MGLTSDGSGDVETKNQSQQCVTGYGSGSTL